jgi:hypothetical protein
MYIKDMASTRNKNTAGDYKLEQKNNTGISNYSSPAFYGQPQHTYFPGNGLLTGRMASENLSRNSCDIESQLFGIGSTNLETPKAPCVAEILPHSSLNVIDRLPILVPEPLVVEKNQRPYMNF